MGIFSKFKSDNLFECFPDGLFVLSHDGKIKNINSKGLEILNCNKYEVIGKYFSKFIEGGSAVLNNIVNSSRTIPVKSVLDGGDEIYLELSAKQSPKTKKVYVSFRDITRNYKNLTTVQFDYNKLKKTFDSKNKFFSNIEEEILTPLDSIEGFSKALVEFLSGDLNEKQKKYVQIILKNTSDLNYTLTNVLKYFKLESDLIKFEPRNFDVVNLINQEIKRNKDLFSEKSLTLNFDSQIDSSRSCFQDPSIIQSIISNYINYVYKKTDVGGLLITLKTPKEEDFKNFNVEYIENTEQDKKYILIEMIDSSPVMNKEELNTIFDPYNIIQTDRKYNLGLNFVYPLIKKYLDYIKGEIKVDTIDNKGNVTAILFPMYS